jgi:hypothetical protein
MANAARDGVDEATRPTTVRWTVTDCPFLPDWIGTRPAFTITPIDRETTELRFHHQGLNGELECWRASVSFKTPLVLRADHGR